MKWGKTIVVIVCAVIVTALGVDAADTLTGQEGTLLSQVIRSKGNGCPPGMVSIENVSTVRCVDQFEVSPSETCPVPQPQNSLESYKNAEASGCHSESKIQKEPWSFVTREQAMQLCARDGKRLPTSAEWYSFSLGMTTLHESCNINSKKLSPTGSFPSCKAPNGSYDLVGNLWEWVSDDVIDGTYNARPLPQNGYVTQTDNAGMAVTTSDTENELFGNDYFWTRNDGAFGIVRGGYYDSGEDAGLYIVHADTLPTAASAGIGFRCVK
jgi:formylglycine-generating enzyme required for sulfatase activity